MPYRERRNPRRAILLVLAILCAIAVPAQDLSLDLLAARLKLAGGTNAERAGKLRGLFAEEGCEITLQEAVRGFPPNLVCTLPGASSDVILVGAHFDAIKGIGVADNWSGASLLPTLYRDMKSRARKHTFVFVGFTEEEKGLLGSRQYVNLMTLEQRRKTRAMVNIDTLGLDVTNVWVSKADHELSFLAAIAASEVKVHLSAVEMANAGTTDSESFAGTGIPRITFSSIKPESMKLLHSKKDNFDAIRPQDYEGSYRLIGRFLEKLDGR